MYEDKTEFWQIIIHKDGSVDIKILPVDIIDFLIRNGFGKYYISTNTKSIYTRNKNGILSEISAEQIKDYVLVFVRNIPPDHRDYNNKKLIEGELLNKRNFLLSDNLFNHLPAIEREHLRDTKDFSLIPFSNGVLKIEKDKCTILKYELIRYCVWKDQIRPYNFNYTDEESDFAKFLQNVTGKDSQRYATLQSAFGYLISNYKPKSTQKAIILCDEKFELLSKPEGRTGKSLIGQAISHVRKITDFNGKTFNPKERFAYQNVTVSTQVLFINDVPQDFKFEQMFTVIADGLHIEKKNRDIIFLPYQDSPKVLITTNYSIIGRSASYRDRMFEVSLAPHYSDTYKPIDDFKKEFFGKDWDETDWNKFYSDVVRAIQFYLKNGLVPYEDRTILQRKLYQEFGGELIDYFEKTIKLGFEYDKKVLYNGFKIDNDFKIFMSQRTFTEKLMSYANSQNWKIFTRKSDGDSFIKFEK